MLSVSDKDIVSWFSNLCFQLGLDTIRKFVQSIWQTYSGQSRKPQNTAL